MLRRSIGRLLPVKRFSNSFTFISCVLPNKSFTSERIFFCVRAKKTKEAEEAKKQAEDAEKARIEGLKNPQYTNQETNSYPQLQCTWGAKVLAPWAGDHWGNGGMWAASAASEGFVVDTTPEIGSLICFTEGEFGHIAYVKDVNPDNGQIQILEANYGGSGYQADPRGIGNYRGWFTPQGNIHYIHNKKA